MPHRVRENLFIGNITDAAEILQSGGGDLKITHVLSVLSSPYISFFSEWRNGLRIPSEEMEKVYVEGGGGGAGRLVYVVERAGKGLKIERMGVGVRDMESENLLDYLEACLDFVDRGRKDGSVLVHCFAGVSRSAAVVTAYLMRTERLSQLDALESLKQSCEFVCPNDGFLDQLKMFEEMGFKVDRSSPIYRRFRLKLLGDSYNRGEKIDSSKFGVDPGIPAEASQKVEASPDGGQKHTPAYRCRKCRRLVALQENVIDHVPGEGETSFAGNKWKTGNPFTKSDDSDCSSIFVEPLRWMTAVEEGALEGKLSCAHCEARLGYFNWSGIQCSCGSWITPAFQLHKSRVDISTI